MVAKNVLLAAGGSSGSSSGDPNFNQTVLLLHGDGNQGANNLYNPGPPRYLAFTDNSPNNFALTVNGDAYGTNISPYQASYSALFTASSGLTVPAQQFPGDFTWELWYYPTALGSGTGSNYSVVIGCGDVAIQNIQIYVEVDGSVKYYNGSTGLINSAAGLVVANQWSHIALVRSGSTTTLYVNGVSRGSGTDTDTKNIQAIGCFLPNNAKYNVRGYLSNVRTTTTAVYTSAFTPPTAPLTAISGTNLLLCQANRFADNSASPKTITITGTVTVSPFQPFTLAANNYGSGYFDGTGDYLVTPATGQFTSSGDFIISFWVYPNTLPSAFSLMGNWFSGTSDEWLVQGFSDGTMRLLTAENSAYTASGVIRAGVWQYIAVTRSGAALRLYVNGTQVQSYTKTGTFGSTTKRVHIGINQALSQPINGYLSDIRFADASVPFGETPPTEPSSRTQTNLNLLTCQYSGSVRNVGFIDSSPNYFPITRVGNTTQGTFSPFSLAAGEWSNFFDGTDDRLSIANNAAFDFGTGNFTIECWFYLVADATATSGGLRGANIVSVIPSSGTVNGYALYLTGNSTTTGTGIVFENTVSNTGYFATYTATISKNTWHHVAVARSGTTTKLFFNGAEVVSTTLGNQTVSNYSNATNVGASTYTGYTSNFPGYLSNVRVVKGRAVYTSAFTPSTVPLGATSGGQNPPQGTETSLLTCQSNRFVDNSSSPKTLTRNGDVRVTPFSPFAPTAAYSAATNGGSGYFVSAIGNYLSAGTSTTLALGSGDFCIECWIYLLAYNSNTSIIFDYRTAGGSPSNIPALALQTNGQPIFYFQVSSPVINGSKVVPLNTWTHLAIVRNGSSTNNCTMYMNGESIGTATNTSNLGIQTLAINNPQTGTNFNTNAYFADFRIVTGSPVYTGAFTPPTAPLTAITNTKLLLNFTNAGIYDQTGKNVLETVGNAQVDTNIKKYGTGSMKFDGTGDWLLIPSSTEVSFGSGNFTIEMFVYHNQLKNYSGLIGDPNTIAMYTYTSGAVGVNLLIGSGQAMASSNGVAAINTWQHYAIVRNGNVTTLYVGGVSRATFTSSGVMQLGQTAGFRIGSVNTWGDLNGYIDDLRITKGIARYTANFTPPALAFPDK